ncbi:methyltransferase domain-containing protein [Pontibacter sp. HSC-36F09]|uniref:methyltransferase domain-containing protein n=1 Tax=Pontibacter sp. HSC-36F09 TaxID=2910966 RepID=UPI00209D5F87|nr:methyltransferase domain-containing protein [Pontibacter sp. HSC-36F09]MCP2042691.1 2-polyprenyl-3-methyl-5-hydroxy-6-metoxy-1,4-benzoquinol methylase [Pontibacter sp. HSC-36F09]
MLKQRSNQAELMDDLSLSGDELRRNLEELETINTWLGGYKVVLDALEKLLAGYTGPPLRLADIGCGGGDTLRHIAKWARRKNIPVQLIGIDANDFMVQYARQRCGGFPEIELVQHNVFSESFQQQQYDIIVCSLFCHHFTDEQLVSMFRQLHRQSGIAVIVNDLHRHWLAYHSIKILTRFFSESHLVKNDAPLSVWRAFRKDELQQLVQEAGIDRYNLRWMWAFRWQLLLKKA